jgi:hypothetical protein
MSMRRFICVVATGFGILLAASMIRASAGDIPGKWKALFLGPKEQCPKTFCEIMLNFKVEGDNITGAVHMGNWPGDAPISDGKIDGDSVSFVTIGTLGASSGYPRLKFVGSIHGGDMRLTMTWAWVGREEIAPTTMEWQARKVSG